MENKLEIYTDGGSRPNPGVGANAFCYVINGHLIHKDSEFHPLTTNNQMELKAMINALAYYKKVMKYSNYIINKPDKAVIYTDSQYVQKGITEWIAGWIKRGWKTASKEPVKNKELWIELLEKSEFLRSEGIEIEFKWVKAHTGNKYNELVDSLCTSLILKN